MVIQLLEITPGATSMTATVEVEAGNTVVKALAWNTDTYKDEAVAIDLTHLLSGTDETENISISAEDLGVQKITGFYAVEFFSSASEGFKTDQQVEETPQTGVAINLLPYHECMMEKSLAIQVQDCKIVESSCEENNLLLISTLLDTVISTILFSLDDETIKILKTLDCLCGVCTACPDLGDDLTISGYSYKTVNNNIILA